MDHKTTAVDFAVLNLPNKMPAFLNTKCLKFRITRLVVVVAFAAASLVALLCLYLVEYKMKSVVGGQEYSLAESAAALIGRDIGDKRALLRSIAEEIQAGGRSNAHLIRHILKLHPSLKEEFFNVVVFDARGKLIANISDERTIGTFTAASQEYFSNTVASRKGIVSRAFRSALSGKPIVLITEPIVDSTGRVTFVLAGGINLQSPRLLGQLNTFRPGKSGYFFIIDKDGTVIQHPNQNRILVNVFKEPGGAMPTTAAALKGFEGWIEARTKDGRPAFLAYKQIPITGWVFGVAYPTDEAFAALSDARVSVWIVSSIVAALAGLTGLLATIRLLRPLGRLQGSVNAIAEGKAKIEVLDIQRKDEVGDLSRAFFSLSQQRQNAEAKLANLALTDSLTGLGNRRMFENVLSSALERAERTGQPMALAYLDIDHFKSINDSLGHAIGDQVLVEFARRLNSIVRASDTPARLAGDEFVILFEAMSTDTQPEELGNRILQCMEPQFECDGRHIAVTISIGIAVRANCNVSAAVFLREADEALYTAKNAGRNRYAVAHTTYVSESQPLTYGG
ncbi:diguanylate cyclase domain-containing protein [Massilia sp. WG5]|uniref:sensor domain-containing diguanylate cyclase n=1 Tax=Massilia sp. WG5 TaxID=1707785 RepID=UPI0013A56689|nr:diguanylate cyclase [Massilia sp. WG5]